MAAEISGEFGMQRQPPQPTPGKGTGGLAVAAGATAGSRGHGGGRGVVPNVGSPIHKAKGGDRISRFSIDSLPVCFQIQSATQSSQRGKQVAFDHQSFITTTAAGTDPGEKIAVMVCGLWPGPRGPGNDLLPCTTTADRI